MTIYVGNLPLSAATEDVAALFAPFGEVKSCLVMRDEETGESRGFGFVGMDADQAQVAIDQLDGMEMKGNRLRINESRDRGARPKRRAF